MLGEAGIESTVCRDLPCLMRELHLGAGFVLVTEEALLRSDLRALRAWLDAQPEWSDLPFVLLTSRGGGLERNPAAERFLEDRKSTRLNSSHANISYAVFCLKKNQ